MCSCVEKSCNCVPLSTCSIVVIGLFTIIGLLIIGLFVLIIINKLHTDKRNKELRDNQQYNNEVIHLRAYRNAPVDIVVKPLQDDIVDYTCDYSEKKRTKNFSTNISINITKQTPACSPQKEDTKPSENSSVESDTTKKDD